MRLFCGAFGSTEVDGPNAEKIRRAKLKHSFQLARVKGRHRKFISEYKKYLFIKIALMLELLGRFGRFLDEDDRCNPPVLVRLLQLIPSFAVVEQSSIFRGL